MTKSGVSRSGNVGRSNRAEIRFALQPNQEEVVVGSQSLASGRSLELVSNDSEKTSSAATRRAKQDISIGLSGGDMILYFEMAFPGRRTSSRKVGV
jgi:hypothetical protein